MSSPIALQNILFIDIETVSQHAAYEEMPAEWKQLWDHKSQFLVRNSESVDASAVYERAGIYAEFGKIVCISCGIIQGIGTEKKISLKSFYGDDEKDVLTRFCDMLGRWACEPGKFLCAHNGKEFDYPYLCRRLIINNLPIPGILQLSGKKPWDIPHLDTMEMWKFGDYKNFTSLSLLAHTLGIPTPKDDIDGSMVGKTYWKEKDLKRIVTYCQKDVITVAQVYLRLNNESLIANEHIEIKD